MQPHLSAGARCMCSGVVNSSVGVLSVRVVVARSHSQAVAEALEALIDTLRVRLHCWVVTGLALLGGAAHAWARSTQSSAARNRS